MAYPKDMEGKYKPNPVRKVEIPKEGKGKVRQLGIPTVVDRVIQQAITQVLTLLMTHSFQTIVMVLDLKEELMTHLNKARRM